MRDVLIRGCFSPDLRFRDQPIFGQGGLNELQVFLAGLAQRPGEGDRLPSHEVQRGFDRVGFTSQKRASHKGLEGDLQFSGGSKVVLQAQLHQPVHLGRDDVGRHGDHPFAAQGADGNGLVVVARTRCKSPGDRGGGCAARHPSPRKPP